MTESGKANKSRRRQTLWCNMTTCPPVFRDWPCTGYDSVVALGTRRLQLLHQFIEPLVLRLGMRLDEGLDAHDYVRVKVAEFVDAAQRFYTRLVDLVLPWFGAMFPCTKRTHVEHYAARILLGTHLAPSWLRRWFVVLETCVCLVHDMVLLHHGHRSALSCRIIISAAAQTSDEQATGAPPRETFQSQAKAKADRLHRWFQTLDLCVLGAAGLPRHPDEAPSSIAERRWRAIVHAGLVPTGGQQTLCTVAAPSHGTLARVAANNHVVGAGTEDAWSMGGLCIARPGSPLLNAFLLQDSEDNDESSAHKRQEIQQKQQNHNHDDKEEEDDDDVDTFSPDCPVPMDM